MPYFISTKIFKQQAKILVRHWPFAGLKNSHIRNILSQLYGYKDNHDYLKQLAEYDSGLNIAPLHALSETMVGLHYKEWVIKMAKLGAINHIQAKTLLHKLWPAYLSAQNPASDKLYSAKIRFHGACNDFLDRKSLNTTIEYLFNDPPSIKDCIEAIGVPHPEVGAISINNSWVTFRNLLTDGDSVEVFPNPCPQVSPDMALPFKPEGEIKFLLDVHLGGLARYLRMAGFDCMHQQEDNGDQWLAETSASDNRILLTRDIGLLKRAVVDQARWVRNILTESQFCEIVLHYDLSPHFQALTRCIKCNGHIAAIEKHAVKEYVPQGVYKQQKDFKICNNCQQIYWKGSHYDKMQDILRSSKTRL
ncbi:hypothetical protein MNBD_GAMMA12-3723 [hydrothermal vent metagenome]|uniref:Mut7-C RNAse domain-containing protein n=1 Tax=hydrothermal vent metagenome TaxID=652676 RepID=A0A3B0YZL4_9ZZZZ